MTKSTITREQLLEIIETDHVQCGEASYLARMALAAMDSEPVRNPVLAYADSYRDMAKQGVESVPIWSVITDLERNVAPLYRHAQPSPELKPVGYLFVSDQGAIAYSPTDWGMPGFRLAGQIYGDIDVESQPAPVVMDEIKLRELFDSWFASDCSFDRSPEASEAGNIAWRESYWYVWQRCRAAMLSPRAEAAPLLDSALENSGFMPGENVNCAATLKSESKPCKQCDSEGWIVGEMGITRCACGQAGNSPVIPDGYVMVPKEPTKEMIDAGWLHFMGTKNPSSKGTYKAMLAAAEQEVPDGK